MAMLSFGSSIHPEEDKVKRFCFNVGAGFDIPSGRWVKGLKGEWINMGGVGHITGVCGAPNTMKSTIMQYLALSLMSVLYESDIGTLASSFDTEGTMIPDRIKQFADQFENLRELNVVGRDMYKITDNTLHSPDEWLEIIDDWLVENKLKKKKKMFISTPVIGVDGNPVEIYAPSISVIDSVTEMITESAEKIEDEHGISDSKGNMLYARDGLAKKKFFARLGRIANKFEHYTFITAHMGEKSNFASGPFAAPNTKDLPTMKADEKVKGATDKFLYLPHNVYQTMSANPWVNESNRKIEEYPRNPKDLDNETIDLVKVRVKCLRSKTGQDNYELNVAVSRTYGVCPEVTELEILRSAKNWGLDRSGVADMALKILPDVKFTRNTFLSKVKSDPILRRALNITSELRQIHALQPVNACIKDFDDFVKVIGEKFGWDRLLKTRGYMTLNQYTHPVPYLSSLDLLDMYKGIYTPYWWNDKV